jgi:hypothetical protein
VAGLPTSPHHLDSEQQWWALPGVRVHVVFVVGASAGPPATHALVALEKERALAKRRKFLRLCTAKLVSLRLDAVQIAPHLCAWTQSPKGPSSKLRRKIAWPIVEHGRSDLQRQMVSKPAVGEGVTCGALPVAPATGGCEGSHMQHYVQCA